MLNDVLRMLIHTAHDLVVQPDEYLTSVPDWCDPVGDLVNDLTPLLEAIVICDGYAEMPASERGAIEAFSAGFIGTVRSHAPGTPFWTRTGFREHADWDRLRHAARSLVARFPDFRVQRRDRQQGQR